MNSSGVTEEGGVNCWVTLGFRHWSAVFKAGKLIDNNWLPIHCPVGGNVSCVTLFTMGIIQLLIYDLHAQLKPHPKPTKMTHYCTQLSCISIAMSVRPHNFPNNRWGMPHTGERGREGKQKRFPANANANANANGNGNLLSLLFSQLRPLVAFHSNLTLPHLTSPCLCFESLNLHFTIPDSNNRNPSKPFAICMVRKSGR